MSPKRIVCSPRRRRATPETMPALFVPSAARATRPPSSLPIGSSCSALRRADAKPATASGSSVTVGEVAIDGMNACAIPPRSSDDCRKPDGSTGSEPPAAAAAATRSAEPSWRGPERARPTA